MTKFKQKLEILPIKIIQHSFGDTEYYKAVHVKTLIAQADEEFQELKEQHGNQAESILLMLDEIKSLKSQLQQQALPVVPECVGKYIEDCKKEGDCLFGIFADATRVEHDMPDLVYFWLGDEGNNDELFARAWLDGYEVQKPQLFYLKNKMTSMYLAYDGMNELYEAWETKAHKFTQQEIYSMETGSYEQIEVTE